MRIPQLAGEKDVFTRRPAVLDALSDFDLVALSIVRCSLSVKFYPSKDVVFELTVPRQCDGVIIPA